MALNFNRIAVGDPLPRATVARLENDQAVPIQITDLAAGRTVMFVGMPGAFTPTCSRHHVPNLIQSHAQLRQHGIEHIYVVSTNDPWVVKVWEEKFGSPEGITFLADGNHEFLNRCGLLKSGDAMYLGMRSARFMMVCKDGKVTRLSVENNILDLTCTTAQAALSV
jgi:peroxiredoxin